MNQKSYYCVTTIVEDMVDYKESLFTSLGNFRFMSSFDA